MKNKYKVFSILLCCFSLIAFYFLYTCIFPSPKENIVSLQEIVLSNVQEDLQLIDLRTRSELEKTWVIPWALHIDYYQDDFEDQLAQLDTNISYVIYCHSWVRSAKTISLMQEIWLNNVRDYSPGIKWWIAAWGETQEYK